MAAPKRKAKQMLTLIPEEERAVMFRFNIVLVGEGAKELAQRIVSSEFAEAYHPKQVTSKATPLGKPDHEEDEGGAATGEGDVHSGPGRSESGAQQKDPFVLFCPSGPSAKELVRLRLIPCVGFSDALPLTRDKDANANMVIAFIFWRVLQQGMEATASDTRLSTDQTINDWRSRMAEVNHQPQGCKPYVSILAFEADDDQEKLVTDYAAKQPTQIIANFFPDDSEDSLGDAMHTLAEQMIEHNAKSTNLRASGMQKDEQQNAQNQAAQGSQGSCCAVM